MRTQFHIILFCSLFLVPMASGEPVSSQTAPPGVTPDTLQCEGGGDVRVIKNEKPSAGGCTVLYTKGGQTRAVASAHHETEYCDGVVAKMRTTLEGAGFKCR